MLTRLRLTAALLLAASVLSGSSLLVVADSAHPMCAAARHDCGRTTATIAPCCCGGETHRSLPSAPAEPRTSVASPAAHLAVVQAVIPVTLTAPVVIREHTSPPRLVPLDFQTLFSTLLI